MKRKNLDQSLPFTKLESVKPLTLHNLLTKERVKEATIAITDNLNFNWAAMPIGEEHLSLLQQLSDDQAVIEQYRDLLSGKIMNLGEKRLVLHHLTRGRVLGEESSVYADGEEKGSFYQDQLKQIEEFATKVREHSIVGSTGKPFKSVVQIGIGGSDLGPRALYLALKGWAKAEGNKSIEARFISNVDPDDPYEVFENLDFESTLFILVTKSGTTQETLTNYEIVKEAMIKANSNIDPAKHMVVVTSKSSPLAASQDFSHSFFIDDYVGGRYSSTSAVGAVILSVAFGFEVYNKVLQGAHKADVAALESDIRKNGSLMDALIGIYVRNVMHLNTVAILPYSQALSRFAAHLQQLDMESNGKQVNRDGELVNYSTGPIIFGEPGTNGQHSFYQLLHQGTDITPLQFIGFIQSQRKQDLTTDGSSSQEKLVANLIAQIVAFADGKIDQNPNKQFLGNRPSTLLFAKRLTPEVLGSLLAHYENKVMFQGFLWNINSFDQEGVQLGKLLANKVLSGGDDNESLLAYMELLQ